MAAKGCLRDGDLGGRAGARAFARDGTARPRLSCRLCRVRFPPRRISRRLLDPLGTLVHDAGGRDVEHVFVDGRQVIANGLPTMVDAARIRADAQRAAEALWAARAPMKKSQRSTSRDRQNTATACARSFDAILSELINTIDASRTTLRLDDATDGFHIDDVVAEALAPGENSLRGQTSINQRAAATAQWVEKNRRLAGAERPFYRRAARTGGPDQALRRSRADARADRARRPARWLDLGARGARTTKLDRAGPGRAAQGGRRRLARDWAEDRQEKLDATEGQDRDRHRRRTGPRRRHGAAVRAGGREHRGRRQESRDNASGRQAHRAGRRQGDCDRHRSLSGRRTSTRWSRQTLKAFGRVDILAANVGIFNAASIEDTTEDDLGPPSRSQSQVHVLLRARGDAGDEEAEIRPHHHHELDRGSRRLPQLPGLLRLERRRRESHQGACLRACRAWHHGEWTGAGPVRDADQRPVQLEQSEGRCASPVAERPHAEQGVVLQGRGPHRHGALPRLGRFSRGDRRDYSGRRRLVRVVIWA